MKLKLTRRQFGRLVLASTTVAAGGLVFSKTLAQESNTVILGVRTIFSDDHTDTSLNSNTTDLTDASATADIVPSTLQPIVVESFNVSTQEIKTVLVSAPILEICEQLSGFASFNGRLVVAATNTCTTKKKEQSDRLIYLDSLETVNILGLKNNEGLLALLRLTDGSLAGLIGKKNGKPPLRIANINPKTGEIGDRSKLPAQKQVTAIAQCPDGTFYGIETEATGETNLFQVGQKQSKKLNFKGSPWNNGFSGLACAPSNQLFALGALRYEFPKYVHIINPNTGEIKRIEKGFDVYAITVAS